MSKVAVLESNHGNLTRLRGVLMAGRMGKIRFD
jgi:hypothetical protein